MLVVVDYGVGNLASMQNMFKRICIEATVSKEHSVLEQATKIILPGVGAFDTCAEKLNESGLTELLNKKVVQEKTPVLGVCVGMQLLTEGSDEGVLPGLGWIKGRIVKFNQLVLDKGLKIPHMGWTEVKLQQPSLLFKDMYEDPRFYFVHSYHAQTANAEDVLLTAEHGYSFTAAIQRNHIAGVQFHPEKSHKYGMKLLENFARYF
jgi:imidazole glycerol-phosphate synthase subunit HisH